MTTFEMHVFTHQKADQSIKWSNKYYCDAADSSEALLRAQACANAEANILWDNYEIYKVSVRSFLGGNSKDIGLALSGNRADGDPDVQLPLFNTIRLTWTPVEGRRYNTYFRAPLIEAEVTGFKLDNTYRTFVHDSYVVPLGLITQLRNAQSQAIQSITVNPNVQNRQTAWHRRTRPGFKRGWVPTT